MISVFITAFEPYDRWKQNASWSALVELTKNLPDSIAVTTRLYPVDFQQVRKKLEVDLTANYDIALHLGQSPGIGRIHLEAVGLNIGGLTEQMPEEFRPLVPDGPAAYDSQLPLGDWVKAIRAEGIPAAVSYHAGTYLCNALLYLSCHYSRQMGLKTRSTFVHVPLSPVQIVQQRADTASMSTRAVAAALHVILDQILCENVPRDLA